jgi:hypothetical protein
MITILVYVLGIAGAILACMGLYTTFTGDTTIQLIGGQMLPQSMQVTLQMDKRLALPCILIGLFLFLAAAALAKRRH